MARGRAHAHLGGDGGLIQLDGERDIDQVGRLLTLPTAEAALASCVDSIRRAQRGSTNLSSANRIIMYVWPPIDASADDLATIADHIRGKYSLEHITVVSPDSGRVRLAERWSDSLGGTSLAFVHKTRDPLVANQIGVEEALQRASVPLRGFMQKNVREKDLKLFLDLSGEAPPATPDELALRILVPAFMISELKRAFEIGFLLFLPFLIIDLVVASVLMSMGMMMLPPATISLPFKLIFFVLVDGWSLVAGSLVQSYGG